jgi:hypothetical protein
MARDFFFINFAATDPGVSREGPQNVSGFKNFTIFSIAFGLALCYN